MASKTSVDVLTRLSGCKRLGPKEWEDIYRSSASSEYCCQHCYEDLHSPIENKYAIPYLVYTWPATSSWCFVSMLVINIGLVMTPLSFDS